MTVHFSGNLDANYQTCLAHGALTGVCVADQCRRIYYLRSLTALPPFSPSQCCGSATFFSSFLPRSAPLPSSEIILKEVCQPTEVAQRDWRDSEPMRDFINIKFDPFFVQCGPAPWWEGFGRGCLPLCGCWCGVEERRRRWREEEEGALLELPSVPRTSSDDVTGSQSKVSPGGWRKKPRCLYLLLVKLLMYSNTGPYNRAAL